MARLESAAEVYDALGTKYEHAFRDWPERLKTVEWLLGNLPSRAKVLDVGSGTGRPTAELIAAAGHDVTGCDVSPKMIEIARSQVPAARFELADMRSLTYPAGTWDAIVAFFSMLQLTRSEQDAQLARFADWLAPGGHLTFGTVPGDADDVVGGFMGHTFRSSTYPAEVFAARLAEAGLDLVYEHRARYTPDLPGAEPEDQVFLIARKPS
ncbi:class I SAM-dependent methyltransferase [Amycolatopsis sp. NPDC059021]|uniref:class I SAM-dependent methyltransferase n=1 Tax=Amycolatopsis sp. NPDC059021 TaxID=3346704 RepID=UPI00366DD7B8